jgi:hypothetical protein
MEGCFTSGCGLVVVVLDLQVSYRTLRINKSYSILPMCGSAMELPLTPLWQAVLESILPADLTTVCDERWPMVWLKSAQSYPSKNTVARPFSVLNSLRTDPDVQGMVYSEFFDPHTVQFVQEASGHPTVTL